MEDMELQEIATKLYNSPYYDVALYIIKTRKQLFTILKEDEDLTLRIRELIQNPTSENALQVNACLLYVAWLFLRRAYQKEQLYLLSQCLKREIHRDE